MNTDILQKALYVLQGLSMALYLALLVTFLTDGANVAIIIAIIGIIGASIGIYGVRKKSFPALMTYSSILFAWIILAILHIALIENLIRARETSAGPLLVGQSLISDPTGEKARTYRVLYPTLYALAITTSAVAMMLACLIPTPEGNGWRYPWMRSKANMNTDGFQEEWAEDYPGYSVNPYNMPPMFLGIPTTPIFPMPQRGRGGPSARSMPSMYDPRMLGYPPAPPPAHGYEDSSARGYRPPQTTKRRPKSQSQTNFDEYNSHPQTAAPGGNIRRESAPVDHHAPRRRSSAVDNFGFL